MIVLDASVVVDLLLNVPPWAMRIARRLAKESPAIAAPHLLDAEVGQVLRRFVRSGTVPLADAEAALEDLAGLPITRYSHVPLLSRAFELRNSVTIYDALYLVLTEALGATLLTRDTALAKVHGHAASVEVVT